MTRRSQPEAAATADMTICIDRSTELIRASERVVSRGCREGSTPLFLLRRGFVFERLRVVLLF